MRSLSWCEGEGQAVRYKLLSEFLLETGNVERSCRPQLLPVRRVHEYGV